jgi:type VI secretion system protein ImpG
VRDDLLLYYERELRFIRRMGAEFAVKYPKIASRLQLEENKCEDPHVERLIESFAFLAARVHLKVDDQFPEITDALFNTLYPHYVRPAPSMSVVQFHLDPDQGKLATGWKVPKQSVLLSRPVNGVPCRFRTSQETVIWPVTIANAEWKTPERLNPQVKAADAVAACRLEVRGLPDVTFAKLDLNTLRVYLSGDGDLPYSLYELLLNNTRQILIRDLDPKTKRAPITLPRTALKQAGFEEDEALLPFPLRSFRGYRLMQEYFSFPQKFLFLDISGFEAARAAGFGSALEVIFLISPFERNERHFALESAVTRESFRLGCTPVINLFPQVSEPILLHQRAPEYLVVPDARRRQTTEAFSIESVTGVTPDSNEAIPFEPFYAYRHSFESSPTRVFWYATRRPSGWATDGGTDVYLSLVDLSNRIVHPDADAITCRLLCFNRDLPSRLPFGNEQGDFELEGGGPVKRIVALVKPTGVIQPPLGRSLHWRLISQLSLNYLSLIDGGVEAFREILRVQNFNEQSFLDKQIAGITAISSKPSMVQMASENGISFARGRRVEIEFDEEQFTGGGVYLFASILEQFLSMYVSLNSFVAVTARTQQRKESMKEWPARAGTRVLA